MTGAKWSFRARRGGGVSVDTVSGLIQSFMYMLYVYTYYIYICVFVHGAYTFRRDKSNISIVRRADGVAGAEGGGEVKWEMRERTGRKGGHSSPS